MELSSVSWESPGHNPEREKEKAKMQKALRSLATAALLVTGLAVTSAEAAPAASGLTPLKALPEASSAVEKTYWVTKCYWRHGHKHCHKVWVKPHRHYHHHRHYRRW